MKKVAIIGLWYLHLMIIQVYDLIRGGSILNLTPINIGPCNKIWNLSEVLTEHLFDAFQRELRSELYRGSWTPQVMNHHALEPIHVLNFILEARYLLFRAQTGQVLLCLLGWMMGTDAAWQLFLAPGRWRTKWLFGEFEHDWVCITWPVIHRSLWLKPSTISDAQVDVFLFLPLGQALIFIKIKMKARHVVLWLFIHFFHKIFIISIIIYLVNLD